MKRAAIASRNGLSELTGRGVGTSVAQFGMKRILFRLIPE